MNVALDLCSNRMRSLYLKEELLKNRSIRSAFAIFSDDSEIRDAFRQLKIPYAILDGRLMVYGDFAHRAGRMFGSAVIPLFPQGEVPQNDPPRRQLIAHLLDLLLPKAKDDNSICMMTVPGGWNTDSSQFQQTTDYLKRIVTLKNYEPVVVNPGLASAFAELGNNRFTGLTVTIADNYTYFCLLIQAREIFSFAIPQASLWFLQEVARKTEKHIWNRNGEKLLDTDGVANALSNGSTGENEFSKPVESSLDHLLRHLFLQFSNGLQGLSLSQKRELQISTLPVIFTGDLPTLVPNLENVVEKFLDMMEFPFEIEQVKVSESSEHSITRGCLICAELERNESLSAAA